MMKYTYLLILMMTATILALPACNQTKTGTEKVVDNVNDALDRRPGEQVLDAAEDASDTAKDTGDTLKDNVNDAFDQRPGEKALDAAEDASDKLEDAGEEVKESGKGGY